MINNEYKDQVAKFIDFAQKNGATESQINIMYSDDFSVEVRNGEIQELNKSISNVLTLKLIIDDKVATASTSDLREATINKLILSTIERAKYSQPDTFSKLADFQTNDFDLDKFQIFDENVELINTDYKIAQAKEIEKIALSDARIALSDGAMYGTTISQVIAGNSNGFLSAFQSSSVGAGIHLHSKDENNTYEDGWWENAVFANDLPQSEAIANKAISRATRLIGAKKIESQVIDVVFEPSVASSLFGMLSSCLSGGAIYMKRSCLADKLRTQIAVKSLNITDNPFTPRGVGSIPFDSDYTPTKLLKVVENGVLNSYLLDLYYGRKLNMQSTGHASGVTNFIIHPTNTTQEELVKSMKKGLIITSTIGQGTDTTTGDISKGLFGLMVENGEITHPVFEVTFTVNLLDLLMNIEGIANNPLKTRSIQAPAIKVKNVNISGY
jgi:PmbA protein